ncbi:MAG: PIN domain-containing protein [Actinomycetota bacterium]|nr:PIN domain-containing protein [Actinomycetota bacterium]
MALLVLDAEVLIAHERGDRTAGAWLARAATEGVDLAVAAPTIAEAWRDGARQARLARLLASCRILDCDRQLADRAGELLARVGSLNTLDALLVASAQRHVGVLLTDDVRDVRPLAEAANVKVARLHPTRR